MNREWVKLKKGNDWGYQYLSREPKSEWGTCSAKLAEHPEEGSSIRVRLPDGTVKETWVVYEPRTQRVSDHGNPYTVSSSVPAVLLDLHGIPTRVSLDKVEVDWSSVTLKKEGP